MTYDNMQSQAQGLNADLTPSFFTEPPTGDRMMMDQPASGAPPLVGYGADSTLDLSSGGDAIPTSANIPQGSDAPMTPPTPRANPQQLGGIQAGASDDADLEGSTITVTETEIEVLEDESWTLRRISLISGLAAASMGIAAGLTWFLVNRSRAKRARKQAEQLAQAQALLKMASPSTRRRMIDLTTSGARLSALARASSQEAQRFAAALTDAAALVAQDIRDRTASSTQDLRGRATTSAQVVRERTGASAQVVRDRASVMTEQMTEQMKGLSQQAKGLSGQVNTLRTQAQDLTKQAKGVNKQVATLSKQANELRDEARKWAVDLWERSRATALTAFDAAAKTAATAADEAAATAATAADGVSHTANVARKGAKRVRRTATR